MEISVWKCEGRFNKIEFVTIWELTDTLAARGLGEPTMLSIWSTRKSHSYGLYALVEQLHKCKVYYFSCVSYDSYVEMPWVL
jgi:hypothetical protein